MGREIRQVPMGWEHPKKANSYQPMRDTDFETAMQKWFDDLNSWKNKEFNQVLKKHPEYGYNPSEPYQAFCSYHGNAPDPEDYRPAWPKDSIMGYAVYETVSEGSPITPTFSTEKELIEYLITHGTYWDSKPWDRSAAEGLVKSGWAFSMLLKGNKVITPEDKEMYEYL